MKIFVLPVHSEAKPPSQGFKYPHHNEDYGVEQDFLKFLNEHRELTAPSSQQADWHYLPVFWTRWHLNHDYGTRGIEELRRYVDDAILDDSRTFTVCQYDDGPLVPIGRTLQFLAARRTEVGIDIPVLCSPHRRPFFMPKKRYQASFVGRLTNHPLRGQMAEILKDRPDVVIRDEDIGTKEFVKMMLQSYLALSPRGYGGTSFRLFEAMQLGIAPVFISDKDSRPFGRYLPWDEASIYVKDPEHLNAVLDGRSEKELLQMGVRAAELYKHHLAYQKWCPYVLKILSSSHPSQSM
ncbi:MAG: glycosyltransferase family 47 protein [Nitrospira sp.]|nr:glycosyltransferase family 47 protein [Nitrospira sp.]